MISRNTINIIICLLLLAPFHAKGALPRSDCTAPLPASINVPSLSVPSTLEVGKDIPGAKASFSIVITCTNTFNGVLYWYVRMDSGAAIQLVSSVTDVYTVPGMPAGVVFRIRGPGGAVLIPIVYGTAASTFDFGVAKSPVSVIQGSFELVKTASAIAVGSFSFSTNAHVDIKTRSYPGLGTGLFERHEEVRLTQNPTRSQPYKPRNPLQPCNQLPSMKQHKRVPADVRRNTL